MPNIPPTSSSSTLCAPTTPRALEEPTTGSAFQPLSSKYNETRPSLSTGRDSIASNKTLVDTNFDENSTQNFIADANDSALNFNAFLTQTLEEVYSDIEELLSEIGAEIDKPHLFEHLTYISNNFSFLIQAKDEFCQKIIDCLHVTKNQNPENFKNSSFSQESKKHFKNFEIQQKAAVFRLLILDQITDSLSAIKKDLYKSFCTSKTAEYTAITTPINAHIFSNKIISIFRIIFSKIYAILFPNYKDNIIHKQTIDSNEITPKIINNKITLPKKTSAIVSEVYLAKEEIKLCYSLYETPDIAKINSYCLNPSHISMIEDAITDHHALGSTSSSAQVKRLLDPEDIMCKKFKEKIEQDKTTIHNNIINFLKEFFITDWEIGNTEPPTRIKHLSPPPNFYI